MRDVNPPEEALNFASRATLQLIAAGGSIGRNEEELQCK
jgi:hypothetical protein